MDKIARYGTIIAVAAGLILGGYQLIKRDAKKLVEGEKAKQDLTAIGERIKDNEKLKDFSLPALCHELDGVWVNDECK